MNKKLTTDQKIDELAIMVKNGFDEVHKELSKKADASQMEDGFNQVNTNLNTLIKSSYIHENRITKLEDDVRVIKTSFKMK